MTEVQDLSYPDGGLRSFYLATLVVPTGLALFITGLFSVCAEDWWGVFECFLWIMIFPVANFLLTQLHRLCWGWWLGRRIRESSGI